MLLKFLLASMQTENLNNQKLSHSLDVIMALFYCWKQSVLPAGFLNSYGN